MIDKAKTYTVDLVSSINSKPSQLIDNASNLAHVVVSSAENKSLQVASDAAAAVMSFVAPTDSSSSFLEKVSELSEIASEVDPALVEYVMNSEHLADSLSMTLNSTVHNASEIMNNYIDNTLSLINEGVPDNIVSTVVDKFPSLKYFLSRYTIEGNSDKELVDSVFSLVNNEIDTFKKKNWVVFALSLLIFCVLVQIAGLTKRHKKQRKETSKSVSEAN